MMQVYIRLVEELVRNEMSRKKAVALVSVAYSLTRAETKTLERATK